MVPLFTSLITHFSFKLKKAKYFCMLLAEFHNQVWFVFLGPSYWYFFPLQLTWNDQVRNEAVSLSVGPQSAQFLRQQICTAINESVHSCWLITLFSSKWKLRTCLNLPVQAVRRAQREARGLGRGWCEGISTEKTKQKSDWVKGEEKKAQAWKSSWLQRLQKFSANMCLTNKIHKTVLFSKRQIYS